MKAKSTKLRMLVTMHTIFKHADAEHRINCKDMGRYLEPYGLKNSREALRDTVRVMREFGIDVKNTGECDSCGIWVDNRPFSKTALDQLVFAVSTNPHLSKRQADEILASLTPMVTSYQEEKLVGNVRNITEPEEVDDLYSVYSVISEAICSDKRVCFFTDEIKYDRKVKTVYKQRSCKNRFKPKCIVQKNGRLFVVGYNCTFGRVQAVDLRELRDVTISSNRTDKTKGFTQKILEVLDPADVVPKDNDEVIYRGEATFFCRGPLTKELYNKFGPPIGEVEKDVTAKVTYTVSNAVITPQTLHWLATGVGLSIRINGPEKLLKCIRGYYERTIRNITTVKPSSLSSKQTS